MSATPFSDFYKSAQDAYVKQHPEAANEPVPPPVQLIIDQEAATARDFAEGKISANEYEQFQAACQRQVDLFQDNMQDARAERVESLKDLSAEIQARTEEFQTEHPGIVQSIDSGQLSAADAADGGAYALNVAEPLLDVVFESATGAYEHVSESVSQSASAIVEARNSLSCVDDTEREANLERLEAALSDWEDTMDKAHDAIEALHDTTDDAIAAAREKIEADHDFAVEHPGSMVLEGQIIEANDAEAEMQAEAGIADA